MERLSQEIKFAHISPVSFMHLAESKSGINLVLAHLVGNNEYTKFYMGSDKETIMDNSAFELGESFDPEKLIDLGNMIAADYLVLPDYPSQHFALTIEAAEKWIPKFKKAGFKTFFVPQSDKGDLNGYLQAWKWALDNPDIDLIGCSILGAPNALGLNDKYLRMSARYTILSKLVEKLERDLDVDKLYKRVHMLGMLDTVREISLCKMFEKYIYSWDSSAAVWAGMNCEPLVDRYSKFELPVDFSATSLLGYMVEQNIDFVNSLLSKTHQESLELSYLNNLSSYR